MIVCDKGYYRLLDIKKEDSMLDTKTFKTVIENAPLISIDLCIVCDGQVLFGRRTNEPLKGEWFTLGGRIHKNETWQDALLRTAEA